MEKILLAIDATSPNAAALDFACYLGRLTKSKVVGVFLENLVADERPVLKKGYGTTYLDWEVDEKSHEFQNKRQVIEKNIELFKQACESRSARCSVHRDRGVPAREIVEESRYADIVILDSATSFNKRFEGTPTEFVKDVLKDAECPVLIAPENFEGIDEIVFTYDHSKSSAFAIKQFTYLFPQMDEKKALIVQVSKDGIWADKDKYNLKEWLQDHYNTISFETLKGDPGDKLFDYLFKRKNVFVVMGAYGRTALSRFFRHSHADLVIRTVTQPIFIAHY